MLFYLQDLMLFSHKRMEKNLLYTVLSREVIRDLRFAIRDSMSESLTSPDNSFVIAAASERDVSVPLTCRGRE